MEMSFIAVMKDKSEDIVVKNVFHSGDEGQKRGHRERKCPS
ncbi:UNVERIFIED_ORG: hypothetical protein ABRZ91_000700 [Heyndrickxia coagulans]